MNFLTPEFFFRKDRRSMRFGALHFFCTLSLLGAEVRAASLSDEPRKSDLTELADRYRKHQDLKVNEIDEIKKILKMAESLPSLTLEEIEVLQKEISSDLLEILKRIHEDGVSKDDQAQLAWQAREMISQLIALSLKSPNISNSVESWLERNRKSFILLSEALVVTAAIIGAEMALKDGAAGFKLFVQSFGLSVGSILALIIPARWIWQYQTQKNLDQALKELLRSYPEQTKESLSSQLGYPRRMFQCSFVLSQLRRHRTEPH